MRLAPTKNGFSKISLPKAGLHLRQGRRNWHGEPQGRDQQDCDRHLGGKREGGESRKNERQRNQVETGESDVLN
jgi:hypothetical protein